LSRERETGLLENFCRDKALIPSKTNPRGDGGSDPSELVRVGKAANQHKEADDAAGTERESRTRAMPKLYAFPMPSFVAGLTRAWVCFHCMHESDSLMKEPLDSRQLLAFAQLARIGSFTVAARSLHLSQSAVSHSIKALEASVGCRLFDRLGKKVELTQAGEQLLHYAQKILIEMDTARSSLGKLGKWGRGRLRLGASTSACRHIIPPVLCKFRESFPDHAISLEPGDTGGMVSALLAHRIDLAFSLEPHAEPELEFHPLFTDELSFMVGGQHPWAMAGRVEREEIPRQNYILYGKNSVTFRLVEQYFARERMVLNAVIEIGSMEATKELVKLGLGVSVLAPWIASKELADHSLVSLPLGRRKLQRKWGVLHWRGKRLTLAEETFIRLCETVTAALRQ
jgi:LysR family transcriptional regulator, low CO2-responsive transcriptional regulator